MAESNLEPSLILPPHILDTSISGLSIWLFQPWVILQIFLNLSITLSRFKVHSNALGHALAVEVGKRVYLTHLAETRLPLADSQNLEYQLLSYFFLSFRPYFLYTTLWCWDWVSVNHISPLPAAPYIDCQWRILEENLKSGEERKVNAPSYLLPVPVSIKPVMLLHPSSGRRFQTAIFPMLPEWGPHAPFELKDTRAS